MAVEENASPFTGDGALPFMRVLWAMVHALNKVSKRMTRELGVTGPQRLVIRIVGLQPGLSPGRLATILHLHPSTVTGILQRLESEGLVARAADAADRRRARLRLTRKGARLNAVTHGTVEAAVGEVLASTSVRDLRRTALVLEGLTATLNRSLPARRGGRRGAQQGRHR